MNSFIRFFVAAFGCCLLALPAFAQETCSDESQLAFDTCMSDARAACEAAHPGCESAPISLEDAEVLLEEKCGLCADAKNFGKYNKCMKQTRNGLRKTGALTDEIKESYKASRADCKAEKKAQKKGKKGGKKGEEEQEQESAE